MTRARYWAYLRLPMLLSGLFSVHCSAGGDFDGDSTTSRERQSADDSPELTPSLDGSGIDGSGIESDAGPIFDAGPVSDGTREICDGVDNDGNGIIDDLDVDQDGLCDCLRIGTLGRMGVHETNPFGTLASWFDKRTSENVVQLNNDQVTAEALASLQVVVVLNVAETLDWREPESASRSDFTETEVDAFAAWVNGGGGVMTTAGYLDDEVLDTANVSRLLAPLGMGYQDVDSDGYIQDWTPHDVSNGISNIFTRNGTAPRADVGTTVARDASGNPALQVATVGSGRVASWSDEWITYDSEWADIEEQQVARLWLNIIKWLTPESICQVPIPADIR